MKLVPPDQRRAISATRLSLTLAVIVTIPLLLYAGPAWWSQRNVFIQDATPDDYAPVNQGQLKNIATAAIAEMDAKLTGGAGEELHSLANTWSTPGTPTNAFGATIVPVSGLPISTRRGDSTRPVATTVCWRSARTTA